MKWITNQNGEEYLLRMPKNYLARLFIDDHTYDFQVFNGRLVCCATWNSKEILDVKDIKEMKRYAIKTIKVENAPEIVRTGLEMFISKLQN